MCPNLRQCRHVDWNANRLHTSSSSHVATAKQRSWEVNPWKHCGKQACHRIYVRLAIVENCRTFGFGPRTTPQNQASHRILFGSLNAVESEVAQRTQQTSPTGTLNPDVRQENSAYRSRIRRGSATPKRGGNPIRRNCNTQQKANRHRKRTAAIPTRAAKVVMS